MISAKLLLATFAFAIGSASADDTGCDLECKHNGVCVKGAANFTLHNGKDLAWTQLIESPAGYHCECTDKWTGLACDIHYKECHHGKEDVKEHICYHGAQCVEDGVAKDGLKRFGCDCSTIDDDLKYTGAHCGNQQTSADCVESTDEVEGVSWFCVNGGTCGNPKEKKINKKCNCGDDFVGPHCEFPVGEEPVCSLSCENGGQCKFGIKDMTVYHPVSAPFINDNHFDFMHCVCPEGFTGVTCDIPVVQCHKDFCFHGATCIKGKHSETGKEISHCDCSTASSQDGNLVFGGRACEYAHKKDDLCPQSAVDDPTLTFCLNGGSCKSIENARSDGGICECIDNFTGPKCEYTEDTAPPKCDLECGNGGECRTGVKDFGPVKAFDDLPFVNKTHVNFQYCACPDGFTGLKCEIEISDCGSGGDHMCLNGGTCQERAATDGSQYFFCDCSTGNTDEVSFAGAYCQHIQTQVCHEEGGAPGDQFCANGGKCKDIGKKGNKHLGCNCKKTGYNGEHCETPEDDTEEISVSATAEPVDNSGKKGMSGAGAFFLTLFVIGAVVGGAYFGRRKLTTNKEKEEVQPAQDPEVRTADAISDTTSQTSKAEKTEEGDMHNVEII